MRGARRCWVRQNLPGNAPTCLTKCDRPSARTTDRNRPKLPQMEAKAADFFHLSAVCWSRCSADRLISGAAGRSAQKQDKQCELSLQSWQTSKRRVWPGRHVQRRQQPLALKHTEVIHLPLHLKGKMNRKIAKMLFQTEWQKYLGIILRVLFVCSSETE